LPLQFESWLTSLGWDAWFQGRFAPFAADGLTPARVLADYGAEYLVHDGDMLMRAVAGRHLRNDSERLPAVGDWVGLSQRDGAPAIRAILERRTTFSRKDVSVETKEQVLAANVDVAFAVASGQDVSVRRIERYLAMAWQGGAMPVIVLTKADVAASLDKLRSAIEFIAAGAPVLVTSSITGEGVDGVIGLLQPNRTGVFLGPSGVGKSTLINRMAGQDVMKTKAVFRTGEGRHMTSHRELIQLPDGGMIIDTPGLREAQLWEGDEALGTVFEDIETIALACRFSDCAHRTEPGCAVNAALRDGTLDEKRVESYRKLQRELRAVAARSDARLRIEERRKWKQITMANRAREHSER
jgi:ribosome biogenesis GTPase